VKKQRKNIGIILTLIISLFIISGCLQVDTVIRVNKDGSGAVERTFTMQKDILEMIKAMSSMDTGQGQEAEDFNLLNREELALEAGSMGEGVKLLSAEPYETDLFEGYKAVFSFSDINSLQINQNPGESVPSEASEGDVVKEIVTFSFKKGNPSKLSIFMPNDYPSEESEDLSEPEELQAEELEMIKQIYSNMRMTMSVEVDGAIESTNAVHQAESRITLMELDLSQVVKDEEKLKQVASSKMDTIEGLKDVLEDIPGIKVELQDTVEVLFR